MFSKESVEKEEALSTWNKGFSSHQPKPQGQNRFSNIPLGFIHIKCF
jgi:hypothetical protein